MQGVFGQLLAHHLPRGARGEAEAPAEVDAGLKRVALGRPLVALTAQVPRLVREHGQRARRSARRDLALERQPVEIEAALGREVRDVAADERDTVGVLDGPDAAACLVAADGDGLPRDLRGLAREALVAAARVSSESELPAGVAVDVPEDQRRGRR